jgi:hypothetical protein
MVMVLQFNGIGNLPEIVYYIDEKEFPNNFL